MSLDIVFAEDAPREALNAIVDAHPAGDSFVKPLLRYIGLFAPSKSQMSHSRIAALINEVAPMIRAAQIERNGRSWSCPVDYWRQGFDHMLSQRDQGRLKLPLKSHGYLLEVLSGIADKAESRAETHTEHQRQGHAGLGAPPARAAPQPTAADILIESQQTGPRQVTEGVAQSLSALRRITKEMNQFSKEGKIHD